MRPLSHLVFSALLALSWTSLASAETPTNSSSLEANAFEAVSGIQLDDAFEKSTARNSKDSLLALAGPTSMDCRNAATRSEFETCVVTAEGKPQATVPTALAQH